MISEILAAGADGLWEPLPIRDGVVSLEEGGTYVVRVDAAAAGTRVLLGTRELSRTDHPPGFSFSVGFWAGHQRLHAMSDGNPPASVDVHVKAASRKLSDDAWAALLAELDAWVPGLVAGIEGGLAGQVGLDGASVPLATMAVLPLAGVLLRALDTVLAQPRLRARRFDDALPMHAVRRVDPALIVWLSRHADAQRGLNDEVTSQLGEQDLLVPQRLVEDTRDHPANRYLAWLLHRVDHALTALQNALERSARHSGATTDAAAWCLARAQRTAEVAAALRRRIRRSFLGKLERQPPSGATLLTVLDDPAYARVHRLARRFLKHGFHLGDHAGDLPAPLRPSFDLYELWALLATVRGLKQHLGPQWSWTERSGTAKALRAILSTGEGAVHSATGPAGETLLVEFNPTFRSLLTAGAEASGRFSIARERRPDIVVSLRPKSGLGQWVCLDAKYRHGRGNLAEAFESAHLCRDSLWWEDCGGRCATALLLVPAVTEGCEEWFSEGFRERYGEGAWRLRPGEAGEKGLGAWVAGEVGAGASRGVGVDLGVGGGA